MVDAPQAHTCYFVCATPRSGSTLLSVALSNTGVAGHPDEYFVHLRGQGDSFHGWDISNYPAYVRRVQAATMTSNGVFGAKMMGGHVWEFVARLIGDINDIEQADVVREGVNRWFPNLHHIWLTRRNKVRQAVSWVMAEQTGQWTANQPVSADAEPCYDFAVIDHHVQELVIREAALQAYFETMGVIPLTIVYEDFSTEPLRSAQIILDTMSVTSTSKLGASTQRILQKQTNPLKEAWVQRYRQEKQQGARWWRRIW